MISEENLRLQWALAYPFPRPRSSFVFVDGETVLLEDTRPERVGDWTARHRGRAVKLRDIVGAERAGVFDRGDYHAVVAVGSNAAPVQLRRKYADHLGDVVVPVVRITVPGHVIAWGKHVAPYGSIGATIAEHAGASVETFATLLGPHEFELMNGTENLGETYDHHPVTVEGAPAAVRPDMVAYRSLAGHMPLLVEGFSHDNSPHPYGGQWEAQQMAVEMLGLDISVDRFLLENATDPAKAAERDAALARA
ncbi:hypothetical protein DDZ18_02240 [Marinicauda salina]|uniref:Uncharacterized protein n=1 Tax=Marinicauda salina TaxID=2135793 RepID=A0A2U2BWS2_9PROT|nr:hypothetical protein [Marinicauda salina]PWE18447.1 hypothetical protein DDZ18_02240 [Marinicauda salina]